MKGEREAKGGLFLSIEFTVFSLLNTESKCVTASLPQ